MVGQSNGWRRILIVVSIVWIAGAAFAFRHQMVTGAQSERTERETQAQADLQDCQKTKPGPGCTADYTDFMASSGDIYADETKWDRPAITNAALVALGPVLLAWLVGWIGWMIVRRMRTRGVPG